MLINELVKIANNLRRDLFVDAAIAAGIPEDEAKRIGREQITDWTLEQILEDYIIRLKSNTDND